MRVFSLFVLLILFSLSIFAEEVVQNNPNLNPAEELNYKLEEIDKELEKNIWITRYNNYLTYRQIEQELAKIKKDAKKYGSWKGAKYQELSYQLTNKIKIKENELELISEYKDSPIGKLIKPAVIPKQPNITNPFIIIEGFSYMQQLRESLDAYGTVKNELQDLLKKIKTKLQVSRQIYKLDKSNKALVEKIEKLKVELKDFEMIVDIVTTTHEVYSKKISQTIQETNEAISEEVSRSIKISLIIVLLIILAFGVKYTLKKYIEDDDRHYTTNKLVNFIFIIIVIFIILFSYIENVSYLVTILGFASAGIAIALKDWFMSIFGWMAIMTSGAITVGDRVKVVRDGIEVVGDVLDISLFKISVREDVCLTTYMTTRRSGRVFFIPNNYIFTDLIANYTFDELRTVWDGIDVCITFDSNHKRAVEICKSILQSHAKSYTDFTRKRLQKMRKRYVLRSSNPEPRVFSLMEPYGVVITSWYYSNSHATLPLRSAISMEILEAFKAAEDITIAYPTQTVNFSGNKQVDSEHLVPVQPSNSLFDS